MGHAITPDLVDEALSNGVYDAVTIVMNETSTGLMNPVQAIADRVRRRHPEVLLVVDAVSSMAGARIEFDSWGLDVCLAGVQKCFALPPGLTVCAVSNRARDRALSIPNGGYYFSYAEMDRRYERGQTPATPAISLIQALNVQMDAILAEGLETRWRRHAEMAAHVQNWARRFFALHADQQHLSPTVTNIVNTRDISVTCLIDSLAERGALISDGYGDLKGKCFRIAHMGDLRLDDLAWLTAEIEDILRL